MKNQKGFSLVELLIVVLKISILTAIAIPNLIASRRSANEGSAVSSIRAIHSAEYIYFSTDGNGRYTDSLTTLRNAGLIDDLLGSENKSGYSFAMAVDTSAIISFTAGAVPQVSSGTMQTGTRKFCIAAQGFMRSEIPRTRSAQISRTTAIVRRQIIIRNYRSLISTARLNPQIDKTLFLFPKLFVKAQFFTSNNFRHKAITKNCYLRHCRHLFVNAVSLLRSC